MQTITKKCHALMTTRTITAVDRTSDGRVKEVKEVRRSSSCFACCFNNQLCHLGGLIFISKESINEQQLTLV